MDTTGFDCQDDLNALEAPLLALRPLSGGLSRDRMLFEAGRAAARAGYRGRLLMLTAGALVVATGLGLSLARERSGRQALELAIARLEQKQTEPAIDLILPVSVAAIDVSPFSYRALSLVQFSGNSYDQGPARKSLQPGRASAGSSAREVPLRVRDTGKVLQF